MCVGNAGQVEFECASGLQYSLLYAKAPYVSVCSYSFFVMNSTYTFSSPETSDYPRQSCDKPNEPTGSNNANQSPLPPVTDDIAVRKGADLYRLRHSQELHNASDPETKQWIKN
jgi:hypothetical protein